MAVSSAEWRGVRYAFGRGLDPRKKDGVRAHPLVFAAGMLLHAGIFAALVRLAAIVAGASLPAFGSNVLAAAIVAGLLSAAGLLARRLRSPVLRVISTSDDYLTSLFVILFLAGAEASLVSHAFEGAFVLLAAALAVYAPFSKIRHCVLFFVTRARLGMFLGRRGVMGTRPGGA